MALADILKNDNLAILAFILVYAAGLPGMIVCGFQLDKVVDLGRPVSSMPGMVKQPTCKHGMFDCLTPYDQTKCGNSKHLVACYNKTECSSYNGDYGSQKGNVALLMGTAMIGGVMCFTIGGNDAANSWATSVGSGAISLRWAIGLGGIAEWLGAALLGYGVSGRIRKGVAKIEKKDCWGCGTCHSRMSVYQMGMFAALIGASGFLLSATITRMPVSTTHAIVGGIVGMTIAGTSFSCLNWSWKGLSSIIASWFISPAISGIIGLIMYLATAKMVVKSKNPVRNSYIMLPVLYGLSSLVMVILVMSQAMPTKGSPFWLRVVVGIGTGGLIAGIVQLLVVPQAKKWIEEGFSLEGEMRRKKELEMTGGMVAPEKISEGGEKYEAPAEAQMVDGVNVNTHEARPSGADGAARSPKEGASPAEMKLRACAPEDVDVKDMAPEEIEGLKSIQAFSYLIVFVAFLEAFGHGANDAANGTAPFAAVYDAYKKGIYSCTDTDSPWWILAIAGVFISLGVHTVGYRVIQTIGTDITRVDYHLGYCVEFASTTAVVIASVLKWPVSTTHCQVGAIVFVAFGHARVGGKQAEVEQVISWPLVGKIFLSWVITLPCAALISGLLSVLFRGGIARWAYAN